MSPSRLKVFAANRVGDICSRIPATQWRYVATDLNPADFASRGLSLQELLQKVIWWEGPPWLEQDSEFWPRSNLTRELPEFKSKVLILQPLDDSLWRRYTSFDHLLRTVAWCRRFYSNCHHQDKEKSCWLTAEELDGARARLLYLSQLQDFPETLDCLQKRKELPAKCSLLSLRPLLGEDGLL